MQRSLFRNSLFGLAIAGSIGACASPDLTGPCPVPPGATPAQQLAAKQACYGGTQPKIVDTRLHKDVDILFVIDNSPSMSPKQKVLATAIPQFIQAIDATGANYHVGVITTDLGYNPSATTGTSPPWNSNTFCNTFSGDDGVLQNIPCTNRTGLQGEPVTACTALCPDPKYVPANGARYISKVDGVTNVPQSIVAGVDTGPQKAFQCLAMVGDIGCGIEQQLESAKRALDHHSTANDGFNRNTSVLAVIFITDEDDCSVQLMQRSLLDPTPKQGTAACSLTNGTLDPSCLNIDFRCIAKDLTCTQSMTSKGAKTNCMERPDTFLNPIDQYVQFFASLPNPNLVIAGIWTPTLLDNLMSIPTPTKDGQLFVDTPGAGPTPTSADLNRGSKLNAACYNSDPTLTTNPNGFFGQAQLRLSTFIRRFQQSNISENSICDANNYPKALQVIANNIINSFGVDCMTPAPKTVNGSPECVVGYVDATNSKSSPDVTLPVCSAKCCDYFATDDKPNAANDPTLMPNPHLAAEVAACSADPDCYCATPGKVNVSGAANCAGGAVIGLWRAGSTATMSKAAPSGKVVNFQCAVPIAGP